MNTFLSVLLPLHFPMSDFCSAMSRRRRRACSQVNLSQRQHLPHVRRRWRKCAVWSNTSFAMQTNVRTLYFEIQYKFTVKCTHSQYRFKRVLSQRGIILSLFTATENNMSDLKYRHLLQLLCLCLCRRASSKVQWTAETCDGGGAGLLQLCCLWRRL